jgi:hypothetical protein
MSAAGLPFAEVVHASEGRTRLRVASRREDAAYFASIAAGLTAIRGVSDVKATPLTGSIVIFHDQPLSVIGAEAERRGLFSVADGSAATSATVPALEAYVNPRTAAVVGLGLIALWQIYREKYFPSALSVAIHALAMAGLLQTDDGSPTGD